MRIDDDSYEKLRKKYMSKIDESLKKDEGKADEQINTRQYEEFRKENLPKPYSLYETMCKKAEKILPLKPDPKQSAAIQENIDMCHLQLTPKSIYSLAALVPVIFLFASMIFLVIVPMLLGNSIDMFVIMFALIGTAVLFFGLLKVPGFLANAWRMKASNQMVLSIFYIVTYMRHTSNLELAIDFAAEHLDAPLSLDMKKIIWNMETGKSASLKASIDSYLTRWEKLSPEYVESIQNIQSSLLETSEERRLETLEKALSIMLDDTYEQMIHYTHNLKSPITTLHMLGIILPILGLVILPLVVSFMPAAKWYHIAVLYNIVLPASVYFLGKNILSTRPSSYGHPNPKAKKTLFKIGGVAITPYIASMFVFLVCLFIAISPLLIHFANPSFDMISKGDGKGLHSVNVDYKEEVQGAKLWLLEYRDVTYTSSNKEVTDNRGPFGLLSTVLSLFMVIAFGVGLGVYYRLKTSSVMAARREAEKIELEFASALFQLGNRLADGLPLEIAFSKVSSSITHSSTAKFFDMVSINITKLGLSVEEAIFDEEYGAIKHFPSNLIESSMKVLVESAKKGPLVASKAVINVSNYIKQMHRVDERLKDLLADVVSSMKSQISFLTPVIAGIVVGITSMITGILGVLTRQFSNLEGSLDTAGGAGGMGSMLTNMQGGIPTYFFQIVVGLYVVQIVYILSSLVNGIENGADKLGEEYQMGQSLVKSTLLYVILAGIVMILFNFVASNIVAVQG